jgi:hypothetical protein
MAAPILYGLRFLVVIYLHLEASLSLAVRSKLYYTLQMMHT